MLSSPFLQLSGARALVDEDRERAGARVAEAVDVHRHLLGRDAEVLADVLVDARVRLVREEPVDLVDAASSSPRRAARAVCGSFVTANLKSSRPSIRGMCACSSKCVAFQYGRVRKPPPGT